MTGAFDGGAFNDVAFDVGTVTPAPGFGNYVTPIRTIDNDDDLLLAAWFAWLARVYGKN